MMWCFKDSGPDHRSVALEKCGHGLLLDVTREEYLCRMISGTSGRLDPDDQRGIVFSGPLDIWIGVNEAQSVDR